MQNNDSLTGMVLDGFRIESATDIQSATDVIAMARVTGSIGSTHKEVSNGIKTKYAKVTRI